MTGRHNKMALLGCIADDFTGATDLANNLVREGMRTVQVVGVPGEVAAPVPGAPVSQAAAAESLVDPTSVDAIVVALKSRTAPVAEAVAESRAALAWLRANGCQRFFFKYCSTFDSTPEGNIGPVAEALMQDLDTDFAIAAPAFPTTGRTVYQGLLFVNGVPLNESGMQDHPLTPMTDSNLVRWLAAQSESQVGLIPYEAIEKGAHAVRQLKDALRESGKRLAVVDTLKDEHLMTLGEALADSPLITGGSGIALGLPGAYRAAGLIEQQNDASALGHFGGYTAIVSGSCSVRTREQVAAFAEMSPARQLDPKAVADNIDREVQAALEWATPQLSQGPVLIYSTAEPDAVAAAQAAFGRAQAGELLETALARISQGLVEAGVKRLVVAGGETSGAVVSALRIQALRIGAQIDPGVPWTACDARGLALALKSGNFGNVDFFTRAFEVCE